MPKPSTFQVVPVVGFSPATLLVEMGRTATLYNSDTTNTLLLGESNDIQPGYQFTIPLGPGQSSTFTGADEVYGIAPPNITIDVLRLPNSLGYFGSPNAPSPLSCSVVSKSIGSGSTIDLIGSGLNPNQLAIQLTAAAISSGANANGLGSSFLVEDVILDTSGNQWLATEIGLPTSPSNVPVWDNTCMGLPLTNAVVPAGAKLQLMNGGAGGTGALRRCSATVTYFLINPM